VTLAPAMIAGASAAHLLTGFFRSMNPQTRRTMRPQEIAALSAYRGPHHYPNAHEAVVETCRDLAAHGRAPSRGQYRRATRALNAQWRQHNPLTEAGQSALYAWMGSVLGVIAGGMVTAVLGPAVGQQTALTVGGLLGYIGNIVGARAMVEWGLENSASKAKAKRYATWGAVLFSPAGIGPAVGGYLGAAKNPTDHRQRCGYGHPDPIGSMMCEGNENEYVALNPQSLVNLLRRVNPANREVVTTAVIPVMVEDKNGKKKVKMVKAEWVTDTVMIHPSMRSCAELKQATGNKVRNWSVTHVPTGQLIATVGNRTWARELARELALLGGPGLRSPDPEIAQRALMRFGDTVKLYLQHIQRQSMEKDPGEFVSYETYVATSSELDGPITNPDEGKKALAASAALGGLVGALTGAGVGLIAGAALGAAGGALFGAGGAATGAVVGGIYGIPLGFSIGTIWGSVRRVREDGGDEGARLGAGLGSFAGHFVLLPPLGAAVGAYLGA